MRTSETTKTSMFSDEAKAFHVRDFLRTEGVSVASPNDELSPDDTLIRGHFFHAELRPGLFLHCSDVMEERAFTATSSLREGLSCIFFLDGQVDLTIGDRDFKFNGEQHGMKGAAIVNTRSESFRRSSHQRQYLRHLVVSASPEWLDLDGMANFHEPGRSDRFLQDHLTDHRWFLTPRTIELVRQIFAPPPFAPSLRNLYFEGRAVDIVVESIAATMQAEHRTDGNRMPHRHDRAKLQRTKDLIEASVGDALSVELIAREAGMSSSNLQKLFRQYEGLSVFEYVRKVRLMRAYEALQADQVSVQQASLIAGYSNPANFATAFRRQFGKAPRETSRLYKTK